MTALTDLLAPDGLNLSCATCKHLAVPHEGHCYMFPEAPSAGWCAQHTDAPKLPRWLALLLIPLLVEQAVREDGRGGER